LLDSLDELQDKLDNFDHYYADLDLQAKEEMEGAKRRKRKARRSRKAHITIKQRLSNIEADIKLILDILNKKQKRRREKEELSWNEMEVVEVEDSSVCL
jgi:hypothetical protein